MVPLRNTNDPLTVPKEEHRREDIHTPLTMRGKRISSLGVDHLRPPSVPPDHHPGAAILGS